MGTFRGSAVAGAAVLLLGLGGAGCSDTGSLFDAVGLTQPPRAPARLAPVPNSPANALRLLEWTYDNRSLTAYRALLSEDFRWRCGPLDSAAGRTPWTREGELGFATHLFAGGNANQPPATSIQLSLDREFVVHPDPEFAAWDATGRWHRAIRTQVAISILTRDGSGFAFSGHARFSLVRGDSTAIPEELRQRGFAPDSSRWYIRGWDEETAQGDLRSGPAWPDGRAPAARRRGPLDAQPTRMASWCQLKALYR